MEKTEILIHRNFTKGNIDPRIYGSFVEHMGRVVYSGIYEPGHQTANEYGFREDVIEKVRQMGVTTVRYPGGNFVSNYDWTDGIGPRDSRPRKLDLAWRSIETNEVGTDEFMKWVAAADVKPILAVNLGTRGIAEAVSYLEYCNLPAGSYYSDLRCENGRKEPYAVKTWCLGNEMDGDWQIGHKTAEEYGRIACETGKAMKLLDPSIELAACGSSMSTNETFGDWEQTVLRNTYDWIDFISVHQYYGGQEKGTAEFLAQSMDMDRYIRTVCSICDIEKMHRKAKKQINICFDEWGVWEIPDKEVQKNVEENPWQIAPAISEQIYTMEDALLFASMLMSLVRHSDRVKIACQSLLTNVSACIMTEPGGEVWLQTIFYPFACMAKYGRGVVLDDRSSGPSYHTTLFDQVACVDHLMIYNSCKEEAVAFFVNRMEDEEEVQLDLQGFQFVKIIDSIVLQNQNRKATNFEKHDCVLPKTVQNFQKIKDCFVGKLMPLSFQMLRFSLK